MEFVDRIQLLCYCGIVIFGVIPFAFQVRCQQGSFGDNISKSKLLKNSLQIEGTKVDANNIFFPEVQQTRTLKAIIGTDDRQPVDNPLEFPFNTIGRLVMECARGAGQCTGQIIGPRLVLTAGSCVYDPQTKTQCENFKFIPAYRNNETYLVAEVITPYAFAQGYKNPDDLEIWGQFDISVLRLNRDFPINTQTMSYGFFGCEDEMKDMELYIAGYPAGVGFDGEKMYYSQCTVKVNRCDPISMFNHTCDTSGGMGGAAIWAIEGDNVVVVGIHSRGSKNNDANIGILFNRASSGFVTNLQEQLSG